VSVTRAARAAVLALLAVAVLAGALPAAPTAVAGPNRCKVPNVHGFTVARARPRLTGAGCGLGKVHPRHLGPKAVVIAESPQVGALLRRGSKVDLFVRVR
jgi:beta-lactam-binding protein with PASTA domain